MADGDRKQEFMGQTPAPTPAPTPGPIPGPVPSPLAPIQIERLIASLAPTPSPPPPIRIDTQLMLNKESLKSADKPEWFGLAKSDGMLTRDEVKNTINEEFIKPYLDEKKIDSKSNYKIDIEDIVASMRKGLELKDTDKDGQISHQERIAAPKPTELPKPQAEKGTGAGTPGQ